MSDTHAGACLRGSCLCGDIRFEVAGAPAAFFLCHCGRCRKDTGSAHAANLFVPGGGLTWLSGEAGVTTFTVPGTRHQRSFCARCGSALPGVQMNGAMVVVPAGSLDEAATDASLAKRPDAHICCASRAGWDRDLDQVPELDGLPG
ncbi:MAG: GFA family protein [Hyphomonadaceae bacterium]